MALLSTIPEYPPPGIETTLVVSLNFGGNFARLWVTAAPEGSELRAKLDAAKQTIGVTPRVEFKESEGTLDPIRYRFDKGGAYTFAIQEYTRGTSYGGGYQYAVDAAPSETKEGSENSVTVYIGQRMTTRLGTPQDSATLVLWVWNANIRPTTVAVHGEATPAVQNPLTKRALIASRDSDVTTAVAALSGAAVSTAIGSLVTVFKSVVAVHNQHVNVTAGSVHTETNLFARAPSMYATATKCTPEGVSALIRAQRLHYSNDENDATGSGASGPGSSAAHTAADSQNLPLLSGASEDDMVAAVSDCWRCHEAHRVTLSSVHGGTGDTTNVATALPPLMTVHRYFFASLASQSPSTPAGSSSGATLLTQLAGFKEA
jgi:hypothetical protein